jgi:hypothetical protein
MPCLQQLCLVLSHDPFNPSQFASSEPVVVDPANRRQPKLGRLGLTGNVNVWRFDLDITASDRPARRLFAVGRTSERTKLIERTLHAATALIEDMRIDHRRAHITMTE